MEMNIESNVLIEQKQVEDKLLAGFKLGANIARKSYGPKGKNGVIKREIYPGHEVCNDAQTLIQSVKIFDKDAEIGFSFVKELMDRTNNLSGDGRKTTLLIADSILTQGFNSNLDRNKLRDELNSMIPLIENQIDEQKQLVTEKEVSKVASIAGESERLGNLIGQIYSSIGTLS